MNNKYLIIAAIVTTPSYAMNIDSMLLVGDKSGNGVFRLSNSSGNTEYINTTITQLIVENNELKRVEYSSDNFIHWAVTVTHPKFILEPNREKQVGVRALCGNECDFSHDQYFLVGFSPSAYSKNSKNTAMSINFGYRPLYVIPAKEQKVDYTVELTGSHEIKIKNTGNSFIKVDVNQCNKNMKENCSAIFMSLAGRERTYRLPSNVNSKNLKITVVNHDESYKETITLGEPS